MISSVLTTALRKIGSWVSSYRKFEKPIRLVGYLSYAHPEPPGPDLITLIGLAAAGRLDPAVGLTLPWTQLRDALTALAERRISGKAVLTVG